MSMKGNFCLYEIFINRNSMNIYLNNDAIRFFLPIFKEMNYMNTRGKHLSAYYGKKVSLIDQYFIKRYNVFKFSI
jgi:hypothetical protein